MDWVRFLEEHNVPFVTRGPNTKRGEVSVKCPFCEDDPSEHLGINPESGSWGCHRDSNHRGKSARTLIKALIRCSSHQAQNVINQYSHADPDSFESVFEMLGQPDEQTGERPQLDLKEVYSRFPRIKPRGTTGRFFTYLRDRVDNVQEAIKHYDLRCCTTGRYHDRVIIPVWYDSELVGFTARAITPVVNAPRYLASNDDVKTCVLNYDNLKNGGERLFIVEGPFDALRLDSYLNFGSSDYSHNVVARATCTFGTSVTVPQVAILRSLAARFDETYVLFDRGADEQGHSLREWLGPKVKQAYLPPGVDDPGELSRTQMDQLGFVSFNGWMSSGTGLMFAPSPKKFKLGL